MLKIAPQKWLWSLQGLIKYLGILITFSGLKYFSGCKHLADPLSNGELLYGIRDAASVYYNYTGTLKCLDLGDNDVPDLGVDNWYYQTCTEFVMPFCSDKGLNTTFTTSWLKGQF